MIIKPCGSDSRQGRCNIIWEPPDVVHTLFVISFLQVYVVSTGKKKNVSAVVKRVRGFYPEQCRVHR